MRVLLLLLLLLLHGILFTLGEPLAVHEHTCTYSGVLVYIRIYTMGCRGVYRRVEKFHEEKFSLFSQMAQIREILSSKICLHEI